jgi:protein involved in polysaccharide export with SLBB domain
MKKTPNPLSFTDSGDLECPYIGRYPAAGKSCRDLARALKTELEKEYYYQATVIIAVDVMARAVAKCTLVGPVRAPGPVGGSQR